MGHMELNLSIRSVISGCCWWKQFLLTIEIQSEAEACRDSFIHIKEKDVQLNDIGRSTK